jgi:hypothetical protein
MDRSSGRDPPRLGLVCDRAYASGFDRVAFLGADSSNSVDRT